MRSKDRAYAEQLECALRKFSDEVRILPGIRSSSRRGTLVAQLIESVRRVRFVRQIPTRDISQLRAAPANKVFSPLHAACIHWKEGAVEESFWLSFLATHFGKNRSTGWNLLRSVYGRLGSRQHWTWHRVTRSTTAFVDWLDLKQDELKQCGNFGNHRKYQSLDARKPQGTGAAIVSYTEWVASFGSHKNLVQHFRDEVGENPRVLFDALFQSLDQVTSFGRTAKFDFLTLLGNLGFVPIEPGATYMKGATGPFNGAVLLFGSSATSGTRRNELDNWVTQLGEHLGVGMQVMEDALCNWQKSPSKFIAFRG